MRILVMDYEYPPLGGGGAPICRSIAQELARRGHDLDVVTMAYQDLPAFERDELVRVHRVPCRRSRIEICTTREMATYLWPAWRKGQELLRSQPYDLVHAHFIFPTGPVAVALARRGRLPLVISAHGSDIPGYNPHRFQLEHKLMRPAWGWLARQPDRIVTPSRQLANLVARAAPRMAADDRLQVIPHGLRPLPYDPAAKDPRRVLMVGRLLERKGFRTMLRALRHHPLDLELHIVGDGPDMAQLQAMAADAPTTVVFHGWLENTSAQYADLYRTSSIFVFPSQMESFGVVLGEAMMAGLACVTSDVGASPEVVGDTGILMDPDDDVALAGHLARLLADPVLVRTMGDAAHERAFSLYTCDAAADRYEALFEEVIAEHRARRKR